MIHTEKLTYYHEDTVCIGFIAYDNFIQIPRPAVLVAPAWRGQDDFARQKAIELAQMGYIGFAIDIYGNGKSVSNEEAQKLMEPFWRDRKLLQDRAKAAVEFVRAHPGVNPNLIGAIGFCFGGMTVYELLKSGVPIQAVVSFHGVFSVEKEGVKANIFPISSKIAGKLLILQGYEDPLVSAEDLHRVEEEMTKAGVDWQIHLYGQTMHAFTNPMANDPKAGTVYSEVATKRAWQSMTDFLSATLSEEG